MTEGVCLKTCDVAFVNVLLILFIVILLLYLPPSSVHPICENKLIYPLPYTKQQNHSKVAEWYLQAKANGTNGNTKVK